MFDIAGSKIEEFSYENTKSASINNKYKRGIYFINVYGDGELLGSERVIKF